MAARGKNSALQRDTLAVPHQGTDARPVDQPPYTYGDLCWHCCVRVIQKIHSKFRITKACLHTGRSKSDIVRTSACADLPEAHACRDYCALDHIFMLRGRSQTLPVSRSQARARCEICSCGTSKRISPSASIRPTRPEAD